MTSRSTPNLTLTLPACGNKMINRICTVWGAEPDTLSGWQLPSTVEKQATNRDSSFNNGGGVCFPEHIMPWPLSTHWYHKWNLLHFSHWSNIPQKGWLTDQNTWRQRWQTCFGEVGTMINDTPLKTLPHEISLVLGKFRSEENSPGKNKLWRAIGQPLHKRSQRHKILQIAKEAHGLVGDHSIFLRGGVLQGSCQALYLHTLFFGTGTLPGVLYQEFLPPGSDVQRFLCSVRNKPTLQILLLCLRNKPQFLSLSFYMSLHVLTILYMSLHVLTIPILTFLWSLCFYVSLDVLTIPLHIFLDRNTWAHVVSCYLSCLLEQASKASSYDF